MFSSVISLVLRDSDTDSENVSFIRRSVSDGQNTCSSKGVSLIVIRKAMIRNQYNYIPHLILNIKEKEGQIQNLINGYKRHAQ